MSVIDDYLKKIQPEKRKELVRIRALAKEVVPDAEETISYSMPTLKYRGKPLLGFDAHQSHIGVYPYGGREIRAMKEELREFGLSAGAIRVPLDTPISKRILQKVIKLKIKAIDAN